MPIRRELPHLVLTNLPSPEPFQSPGAGGKQPRPSPVLDRAGHARNLLEQLSQVSSAIEQTLQRDDLPREDVGVYVTVRGRPGEPLTADSLEQPSFGMTLLSTRTDGEAPSATVFLGEKGPKRLTRLVESYRDQNVIRSGEDTGRPKNQRLIEGLREIHLAGLRDLWEDADPAFPPAGREFRWEVWLRPGAFERFKAAAERRNVQLGRSPLHFPEAVVVLTVATREALADLNSEALAVARLRRSTTTADFFESLPAREQAAFIDELLSRTTYASDGEARASVCLLDTGVRQGHPLIAQALRPTDCHAADASWGEGDHEGHGTEMAGIAIFGDLTAALDGSDGVEVPHRLESVKIIPPSGKNAYDQLGSITSDAVDWAELMGSDVQRVYCLATTTEDDTPHDGFPTSWSSAVDQLAAGVGPRAWGPRLFCVSAGNLRDRIPKASDYPEANDEAEIECPGQAWNALTMGAHTTLQAMSDPSLKGWGILAPEGDLCPESRTASWSGTWPIKPDVVFEGGNRAVDPSDGRAYAVPDLGILTTGKDFPPDFLRTTRATSPATAAGSRFAALAASQHPDLWPETIRALIVSSARWTDAMLSHLPATPNKAHYAMLLRRFGFGVPDLDRALHSASNAVTLIVQDAIRPYKWSEASKGAILNEMKTYPLPWPTSVLDTLGLEPVRMRVTLSYFIEPNPTEAARGRKLGYASHGLRFKVKLPDEDLEEFQARINKAAAQETAGVRPRGSDSAGWMIGAQQRDVGSLHSDVWEGPASDLARRGAIAVHPVGGWWKDRKRLERWNSPARYSLVVTIDAGEADVDLHTPIQTLVRTATQIIT